MNRYNGRWQFSIDVGGTFTDCVATTPAGKTVRLKILSSAKIRSSAQGNGNSFKQVKLDLPFETIDDQFLGFRCQLFDDKGRLLLDSSVTGWNSKSETLQFSEALDPHKNVTAVQLCSPFPAPVLAIRILMGLKPQEDIGQIDLRLGTTRGTNALLTRGGARTALLTTRGFADILRIGTQQRPELFAINVVKPKPLFERSIEVTERLSASGIVDVKLDEVATRKILKQLRRDGIQSLAICLLHSYLNPEHELRVAELAKEQDFENITMSHRASPLVKFVPRCSTAVLDAYLNPILKSYVSVIQSSIGKQSSMMMMTSSGGLVPPEEFSGKDCILSGPAGGVVGFAESARQAGFNQAIGFDMGGTSTDVSRLDGEVSLQNETRKAGIDIQTPTLAIETVAAGGGSICSYVAGRLTVGPQSAGADPGPACYGLGGPLTVTDLNVWLGRVPVDRFPFPLDLSAVEKQLETLTLEIKQDSSTEYTLAELALALIDIANSHMASAVNTVTTRQGADPQEYALVGFGGAAGQHLCGVADSLGITRVLLHPDAGLLSAYGISKAVQSRVSETSILQQLTKDSVNVIRDSAQMLYRTTIQHFSPNDRNVQVRLQLSVQGTEQLLFQSLDWENQTGWNAIEIENRFWSDFENRFGYRQDRPLEIQVLQLEVSQGKPSQSCSTTFSVPSASRPTGAGDVLKCIDRSEMVMGRPVHGPAVISENFTTTFVAIGWLAFPLEDGQLILAKNQDSHEDPSSLAIECRPHRLELFHHRLTEIATQMGLMLQMTCTSVNVKERLDFSCAIFDGAGNLIVNAPHIPVHLGAMSETVRATIRLNPTLSAGQHFVTNDPFAGGSHLPDVTVVSPVFANDKSVQSAPIFWVASRAHHAEIGGITPGSMPPFSKSLADEGVVLRNVQIRDSVEDPLAVVRRQLESGDFPSRNVEDNLLDLQAQLAANRKGQQLLLDLMRSWTLPVVSAYSQHIQNAAATQMAQAITQIPAGRRSFKDQLECGLTIRLAIEVVNQRLILDFAGTDTTIGNNLNTNPAIVRSAILYCLRLLLNSEIPLNDGVLRPIELRLPICFLNPVSRSTKSEIASSQLPAVVGGNVETSQRVVDVVLGALDVAAASQGTMNNFLFGNEKFGFYETIGGGTGASSTGSGADAVHSHMTNTRLTDPEILERRYPVRLMEFSIRSGSGGSGKNCGGDGMIRRFQFLEPLTVSLLTNRRGSTASDVPFGLNGGNAGKPGENWLIDQSGIRSRLPAACQIEIESGQQVEIRTPGGGGWGTPAHDPTNH